jgi:hypothetical protein
MQQTYLRIDQNMVSVVCGDGCVECVHLLLRYCNLFMLGIWKVGTWNLCDVFKQIIVMIYIVCKVTHFKYT